MIRFSIPPKAYSGNKKIWRWVRFILGVALVLISFFWYSGNQLRQFFYFIFGVNIALSNAPIMPKKQLRFIEINDTQIKWNNYEEYNNKLLTNGPEELNWLEITRIKRLMQNELMLFEENSFYRRIWLNEYTVHEQQIIIDTIKAYAERFSLPWVEEQSARAVA